MRKLFKSWLVILLLASYPLLSFGQESAVERFSGILKRLTNFATWLLLALTVTFVIYAAYLYLTSQGDPEKVRQASKVILYAAISIGVALMAYVFVNIITVIIGKPKPTLPPGSEIIGPGGLRQTPGNFEGF